MQNNSRRADVHEALRRGTAELHQLLETRMDIAGRLGSVTSYRDLLQRFLGVLDPLEAQVSTFSWPPALQVEARRKAPLIRADLRVLGCECEAYHTLGAPDPVKLPCQAAAFGCLYVLEGSTLGGRLILKQVQDALGFNAGHGACFFAGYGGQTGAMWTSFLEVLGGTVTSREAVGAALCGARETFSAMDRFINGGADPRKL